MDEVAIQKEIIKCIKKNGIPKYVKLFKPVVKKEFASEKAFSKHLQRMVKSYHSHTTISKLSKATNGTVVRSNWIQKHKQHLTKFSKIQDGIGIIQLYKFLNKGNDNPIYHKEKEIYIESIKKYLEKCNTAKVRGIIIDFRKHHGGDTYPLLDAFSEFFNNTSLFSWTNKPVTKKQKKWTNMENNTLQSSQAFSNANINTDVPIAIIIGESTSSSGEIVAACFKGSKLVKFFGTNSGGALSVNEGYHIKQEYELNLTTSLFYSKDGKFQEYLEPDVYTKEPIEDAKKWIKNGTF
jgi:C-terminal processing protease CtpA/Prc